MTKTSFLLFALIAGFSQTSNANVSITFLEGAPKDRFVISNAGECLLQRLVVKIDLQKSKGKLIFDTTAAGEGVEVFQPFETSDGKISLIGAEQVQDGQTSLDLAIDQLAPSKSVSFTIDVDDTLQNSELGNIRVSRAEIQGGAVEISLNGSAPSNALFGSDAKALVSMPDC